MKRRRLLIIVSAALLALFGLFIIVAYVNSAEQRAQEGTTLVPVLVATEEIDAATPASELGSVVTTAEVPERLVQNDAITNLGSVGRQVTTSPIRAGEQIVERQFGAADEVQGPSAQIEEGKEIVSIALEPQRAVGGRVAAGDVVSVVVSVEEAEVPNQSDPSQTDTTKDTTGIVLSGVPVTAVTGGVSGESDESGQAADLVMVFLEVDGADAERIVFGMGHGSVWLTQNGEGAAPPDIQTRSPDNIYKIGGGS
jgi:pilus assembly protein CpaB